MKQFFSRLLNSNLPFEVRPLGRSDLLKTKKSLGFAMIEILVALAIIGIIASLGWANYRTHIRRSQNTKRQSDLNQYRIALEAYASNNNGNYPYGDSSSDYDAVNSLWATDPALNPLVTEYLPAIILPPRGSTDPFKYFYND